jgi:hypothetical protein
MLDRLAVCSLALATAAPLGRVARVGLARAAQLPTRCGVAAVWRYSTADHGTRLPLPRRRARKSVWLAALQPRMGRWGWWASVWGVGHTLGSRVLSCRSALLCSWARRLLPVKSQAGRPWRRRRRWVPHACLHRAGPAHISVGVGVGGAAHGNRSAVHGAATLVRKAVGRKREQRPPMLLPEAALHCLSIPCRQLRQCSDAGPDRPSSPQHVPARCAWLAPRRHEWQRAMGCVCPLGVPLGAAPSVPLPEWPSLFPGLSCVGCAAAPVAGALAAPASLPGTCS